MKTKTWPELSPQERQSLPALYVLDGGDTWDDEFLREIHRGPTAFVPYHAVYAVEGGEVLATVQVIRFPFAVRPAGRVLPASGLDYVVTRPDHLRKGLATRLIREVHRREIAAGRRWIFLWTRRSWGAHRAYEKLGYRDVYTPPYALRRVPSAPAPPAPSGYRLRKAKVRDAGLLESILDGCSRGRLGFVPRYRGSFRTRFRLRWCLPQDVRVLLHRGRPVGYVHATRSLRALHVHEAVVPPAHAQAMLTALERSARGRWLVIGRTNFVVDQRELLRARGYRSYPGTHATLMARPLRRSKEKAAPGWRELRGTFSDPRFSLHAGDCF